MKQTRVAKVLLTYPQAWRGSPAASLWTPKVRGSSPGAFTGVFKAGLGFGRVCPMPRPESDRDFSDPVVFGQRNLFQRWTRIGFGLKHPNCRSDRSVFNFYPEKCRVGAEIESAGPTFKYEMGSAYLSLI
jgi:hypothetical protein